MATDCCEHGCLTMMQVFQAEVRLTFVNAHDGCVVKPHSNLEYEQDDCRDVTVWVTCEDCVKNWLADLETDRLRVHWNEPCDEWGEPLRTRFTFKHSATLPEVLMKALENCEMLNVYDKDQFVGCVTNGFDRSLLDGLLWDE